MYYLEVNFILIVYILAFIGAIVMLFLSVVLMLPSSTFNTQSSLPGLLFLSQFEESLHYFTKNITYLIALNLFVALLLLVIRLLGLRTFLRASWNSVLRFKRFIIWVATNRQKALSSAKRKIDACLAYIKEWFRCLRRFSWVEAYHDVRFERKSTRDLLTYRFKHYSLSVFDFFGQLVYKLLFITIVAFMPQNNIGLLPTSHVVYAENLVAIKSVLYVDQPLLLLMSVIGLLIALFGVTAVVMPDRKS